MPTRQEHETMKTSLQRKCQQVICTITDEIILVQKFIGSCINLHVLLNMLNDPQQPKYSCKNIPDQVITHLNGTCPSLINLMLLNQYLTKKVPSKMSFYRVIRDSFKSTSIIKLACTY